MPSVGTGQAFIWTVIVVLGVGTFALRVSFIQLRDWIDVLPAGVEEGLTFIPPAILAALIFPELIVYDGSIVSTIVDPRVAAGGLAAIVAWRTGNMLATIAAGMAVLWGLQYAMGVLAW